MRLFGAIGAALAAAAFAEHDEWPRAMPEAAEAPIPAHSEGCAAERRAAEAAGASSEVKVDAARCYIVQLGEAGGAEGQALLEGLVAEGDLLAAKALGNVLHARNETQAAAQLWRRCGGADAECATNYGMALLLGTASADGEPDAGAAFDQFKQAAAGNDATGHYNAGLLYAEGVPARSQPPDKQAAVGHWLKAAQRKHTGAMLQLARSMLPKEQKGKKPSKTAVKGAVRWLKEAEALGSGEAAAELGLWYKYGRGVRENLEEAFEHFKIGAEAGDMVAQYELALMYIYDDEGGADQGFDDVLARKWMKAAAEQGHAHAMHNYAHILINFQDPRATKRQKDEDTQLALSMYAAAATRGVPDSLYTLGALHSSGSHGLQRNASLSAQYFGAGARVGSTKCQQALHKLAARKLPEALFQMGRLHEEGSRDGSVAQDIAEAERLYEEAALAGVVAAAERLEVLRSGGAAGEKEKRAKRAGKSRGRGGGGGGGEAASSGKTRCAGESGGGAEAAGQCGAE